LLIKDETLVETVIEVDRLVKSARKSGKMAQNPNIGREDV
jgi:hypothetical protein